MSACRILLFLPNIDLFFISGWEEEEFHLE